LIDSASGATGFRQLHIPSITALRERQLFPQEVQAAAHQIAPTMPRIGRRNPREFLSDDEAPEKKGK